MSNLTLIEQALVEQNPHWKNKPYVLTFKRLHDLSVQADFGLDEIQIITGIRRSGKSTLLQALINHLTQKISPLSILYINLDDPNFVDIYEDAKQLYQVITIAEKISGQSIRYLFLDEIQNILAWEQYVKSAYDSHRFKKIALSGSNADLLNSDYASLLSGRYVKTQIYPLAYRELLLNHHITDYQQLLQHKSEALRMIEKMLRLGGFPRIHCIDQVDQCRKLLQNYYETILLKDCISNHNVRDTRTLMNLAHYQISHIGSLYSYNSLSKAIGSNENTLQNFLQIFQDAYFINEIKPYSRSLKSQLKGKKKVYCIDNGLVTSTTFKFTDDIGRLFENLVYTELEKSGKKNICFDNNQKECDFIFHDEQGPIALQVCYEINAESREREIKGIKMAMNTHKINRGMIITYDNEERLTDNIQIYPFWKYFSGFE